MRVVIVTSIHPDFDARIWKHATSLAGAGHEVDLVCPWNVRDASVDRAIRFHPFSRVRRRALRPVLIPARVIGALGPVLRRADLVHFHDIDILPLMAMVSLVRPVVYDVHENYPEEMLARDWIPKLLRRPLSFGVRHGQRALGRIVHNLVLAVPSQEREFIGTGTNSIEVRNYASQGLLQEVRDDYETRAPTVVFTGSQYEENGSLLLLEIADVCRRNCPELGFIAPDRFASQRFRERFLGERERRELEGVVRLVPNVPPQRIMDVLNLGTIAIAPALRVPKQVMAIPTKLFEYMAAGLPMVGSDLPHQADIIAGNDAGLLARPEAPESFADAVCALAKDRTLARQMGGRGQNAFRSRYCWESQMPALLAFYEEIVKSWGCRRWS